jgi:acyl-CoA thioester hydrolase
MSIDRKPPAGRSAYRHFLVIQTRWMDNDVYGHVNNAVYYSYFDTVINRYLIEHGGLDIHNGTVIGIAIETMCRFHKPIAYPEVFEAGLGVGHLGTSSVRYELGLFAAGEEEARAEGHFVHVFVDRASMRPVAMPGRVRQALTDLRKN